MIVISDTSVLSNLAVIDQVSLLKDIYYSATCLC